MDPAWHYPEDCPPSFPSVSSYVHTFAEQPLMTEDYTHGYTHGSSPSLLWSAETGQQYSDSYTGLGTRPDYGPYPAAEDPLQPSPAVHTMQQQHPAPQSSWNYTYQTNDTVAVDGQGDPSWPNTMQSSWLADGGGSPTASSTPIPTGQLCHPSSTGVSTDAGCPAGPIPSAENGSAAAPAFMGTPRVDKKQDPSGPMAAGPNYGKRRGDTTTAPRKQKTRSRGPKDWGTAPGVESSTPTARRSSLPDHASLPGVDVPPAPEASAHTWHSFAGNGLLSYTHSPSQTQPPLLHQGAPPSLAISKHGQHGAVPECNSLCISDPQVPYPNPPSFENDELASPLHSTYSTSPTTTSGMSFPTPASSYTTWSASPPSLSTEPMSTTTDRQISPSSAGGTAQQRERNRQAASRCRKKTKAAIMALEEEERLAAEQREQLAACVIGLRHEVYNLKNMLFQHSACNCDLIQKYLKKTAQRLQRNSDDALASPVTPAVAHSSPIAPPSTPQ
ncbi:hypothetical protein VTK73DRAFT_4317 [Phialemonium thermophilum]|uniref:BZIP domain-containing protein n=1 Tax=Phialemonium thermophilum TaxID=223376 RepID=A0ABR3WU64_9PEZI